MKHKEIYVLRKEPGKDYEGVMIKNALEAFQAAVGGYIEAVPIHGASAAIYVICDEEGRLKGYDFNCSVAGIEFFGPIVIAGVKGEEFTDAPYDIKFMRLITREAGA